MGVNVSDKYMQYNMALIIHFFGNLHLDFLPPKCEAINNEQSQQFQKDISHIWRKRYQSKWSISILAHYYWTITRDVPFNGHKRQAKMDCLNIE